MSLGGVFLPEEMVMEIMSRLPPKSLIRFKSVCKPWCSLFSSPSHVVRNLFPDRDEDNLLLVKHCHKTTQQNALSLFSDRTLAKLDDEQSRAFVLPSCPGNDRPSIEIIGSCNDLICIAYYNLDPRIAMWSPATGDVKFLPPTGPARSEFGFGYDAASQDYKVIRIVGLTAEVYSFKSDSWRGMDCGDLPAYVVPSSHFSRACTNGIFSWLAIHPQDDFWNSVMWFRFSDESFGTFRLPPDRFRHFSDEPYGNTKFFALNDTMSIVSYDPTSELVQKAFQVWVLLEFGVEDSWTLLFTLGPLVGIQVPLWFWNYGKTIMQRSDGRFVLCDPFDQEIESLEIDARPDNVMNNIQIISIPAKYIYNT